jgi:Zinc finger, C3HC4 type (RING finger)
VHCQNYLISGDYASFERVLICFIVYTVVGIGLCSLLKNQLVLFMKNISYDADSFTLGSYRGNEGNFGEDQNKDQQPTEAAAPTAPLEKKVIEIPEYLFRYSSTFFKTATKKDMLFKKLFSRTITTGKEKEKLKSQSHLSRKSKPDPNTSINLKRTDMSMVNFHLKVNDHQDLFKHYRSMSYNRDNKVGDVLSRSIENGVKEPYLKGQLDEEHTPGRKPVSEAGNTKLNETGVNLCSVCYANEPDSVFMRCGHGGICYDCAIDIWKATGECYLCRLEIEQILQVEPQKNEQGEEYLKVIASTQMVEEDEVQEQNSMVEYVS